MASTFDPAEIDVIEDDYTSNLSGDESENASTRRILGLCEYARELQEARDAALGYAGQLRARVGELESEQQFRAIESRVKGEALDRKDARISELEDALRKSGAESFQRKQRIKELEQELEVSDRLIRKLSDECRELRQGI